ncbi:MAG: S24 family peptidase [Geodermatophilaceae bacterium]
MTGCVVRQQPNAESGEIVAAMIDGEATVKTFKRKSGHVWLLPHNAAYEPIPGRRCDRSRPGGRRACARSDRGLRRCGRDSHLFDDATLIRIPLG